MSYRLSLSLAFVLLSFMAVDTPAYEQEDLSDPERYKPLETEQIKKRKSIGISVGSALTSGELFSNEPILAGGGASFSYDARTWLAEMDAMFHCTAENFTGALYLGFLYPFFLKLQTPFAGAGIGVLYAAVDNAKGAALFPEQPDVFSGAGAAAYLGLGYILKRNSNVGFRLHARYFRGFFTMDDPDQTAPRGFLLALEIYFGR